MRKAARVGTNGIEKEVVPAAECEPRGRLSVVELRRNLDGSWTALGSIKIVATLSDGRVIKFEVPLAARGRQWGRKGNHKKEAK